MSMVMIEAEKQERKDNDKHYKTLFRVFLRELLELTHPDLVHKLEFHKARYLDKETYTDLTSGKGYRLDLVCEIPTIDGETRLVLVHTEVEEREPRRKSREEFTERIANYVMTLWLRHHVPVIPLVVSFSRQAVRGLTTAEFRLEPLGEPVLSLRYRQFGVVGVAARRHLRAKNPLGWALAMRMLRGERSKVALQLACERRIVHASLNEAQQILLLNSVKMYARLSPKEQQEYDQLLDEKKNQDLKEASMTWLEQAELRGEKRGEQRGKKLGEKRGEKRGERVATRRLVDTLWARRFGPVPPEVSVGADRVRKVAVLEAMCVAIAAAKDEAEARAQLDSLGAG